MNVDGKCPYCSIAERICGMCCIEYSKTKIPKVLTCGHSYCYACLSNLKNKNLSPVSCPACGKEITEFPDLYPTNYSLLDMCESLFSATCPINELSCLYHSMKMKLLKKKVHLNYYLSDIDFLIPQLQVLEERTGLAVDELVLSIEKKFQQILDKYDCSKKSFANNTYVCFKSSVDEIIKNLQNDEKIYTYYVIDGMPYYGKICLENNMILFHALSLMEIPENSSLLEFDDLKNCFDRNRFGVFLKLCCSEKGTIRLVVLTLFDTPMLSTFLQLCTGECGSSYKLSSFTNGNSFANYDEIVAVSSYHCSPGQSDVDYASHYYKESPRDFAFTNSELVVQTSLHKGGFKICLVKNNFKMNNVVARVISPTKLSTYIEYNNTSVLKIVDCGIYYAY